MLDKISENAWRKQWTAWRLPRRQGGTGEKRPPLRGLRRFNSQCYWQDRILELHEQIALMGRAATVAELTVIQSKTEVQRFGMLDSSF